MKPTRAELENRLAHLGQSETCLQIALSDLLKGKTTWFRKGQTRLGISRELGAAGGILIHRQGSDFLGAYYWERWFAQIRDNSSTVKEMQGMRECAFTVSAHIAKLQSTPVAET